MIGTPAPSVDIGGEEIFNGRMEGYQNMSRMPNRKDARFTSILPETEERMLHVSRRLTVCEILRQIYKRTDDPEIRERCRFACGMAKAMAVKITQHEGKYWGRKFYPWNEERVIKR